MFDEDDLVAIAPRGHPLLKQKRVLARDLCRQPFVLREEGSGTRAVLAQALGRLGFCVKPVLALTHTEAIKRAVMAGIGVAVVSSLTIASELQLGSLAVIPVQDLKLRRSLHLQRIRDRADSPALAAFLRILACRKNPSGENSARTAKH